MHVEGLRFLEDCVFLTMLEQCVRPMFHWLKEIIPEELHKEIGAWRAEEKACEKLYFPMSIQEDCTES